MVVETPPVGGGQILKNGGFFKNLKKMVKES